MPPRALPDWTPPQLATLAPAPPAGPDWIHEIKYDGYRILAWVDGDRVRLMTRNRKDWTDRFPGVVRELAGLGIRKAILDGEIAVELPDGRTSFQALQNAPGESSPHAGLRFWLFDAIFLDGRDLCALPLVERKAALREVLAGRDGSGPPRVRHVRYSDHVAGSGPAFFQEACRLDLEGVISKRASAPYRGGRTRDWVKVKCSREQEFAVGGYTAPSGSRKGLGALHVGTWEGGRLVYRGKVGTGFTRETLRELSGLLRPLRRDASPFSDGPRGAAARGTTWVEPELVVQVRYTEVTSEGRLRHPAYLGLREDRQAGEVRMEAPWAVGDGEGHRRAEGDVVPNRVPRGGSLEVAGVRISNPGRVLYPGQGVTKAELARYYETVSEWMLPHIRARPLTLVRCPAGHTQNCFYQKHFQRKSAPAPLSLVEIQERNGKELYATLGSLQGLLSLVQLGALELHSWNSRSDRLERPDRFIIDLDPDEGVPWEAVVDASLHVRDLLLELGLRSFLRTTGGKGLHVVVPIHRRSSWEEVRSFSGAVASLLAREAPDLYTTEMPKVRRKGRILLDYLRNARGATAVEAYSTRAREGAPVAAPIHWDELVEGVRPDTFTVRNMGNRMAELGEEPWAEMLTTAQSITRPMLRRVGVG
jgi:bifunctional non-homologous end joining protein LigD